MPRAKTSTSSWFQKLKDAYAIHNVISMRTELPFFLIQWDGDSDLEWMELSDPRHQLKPFHFETFFGKEPNRDAHYLKALSMARDSNQVVAKSLFGFWDLFYKLPADAKKRTFLYAGQFLKDLPTWESLSSSWQAMTGHEPASANQDFVQFVRMALKLPVLETELLKAVKEFVKLYAAYLSDENRSAKIQGQVDRINRDYYSRLWPIDDWVDSVISPDKFRLPLWYYDGELADWIKEGIGIDRLPTTAMALMPLDSRTDALDPVQTLIRNAQIQHECIALIRGMPETAATRLQDYGVSIITSCKKGKSSARARLEIKERAKKLQAFVRDRFGVRSVVGIGRTMRGGSSLFESHRDAVLALHMCAQLGKEVLVYDKDEALERICYADLQNAANTLAEALNRENTTEIKLASDRYVQLVLRYSNERIEVTRSQFLATLFQLLKLVQRRNPMRKEAEDRFSDDLARYLEEARSLNQVIESFNGALQRLVFVSSRAWHGPSVMLLEATLQYLRENYFEQLPLPSVARKAGFSVPAFTRIFKQTTGMSYLSYLRTIRVDHAKKLLATTPMTIEQIAQACGFHSQHHLIRSFKKVTGDTPGLYRKETTGIEEGD